MFGNKKKSLLDKNAVAFPSKAFFLFCHSSTIIPFPCTPSGIPYSRFFREVNGMGAWHGNGFALIVVLFILLIIVGTAFVY